MAASFGYSSPRPTPIFFMICENICENLICGNLMRENLARKTLPAWILSKSMTTFWV